MMMPSGKKIPLSLSHSLKFLMLSSVNSKAIKTQSNYLRVIHFNDLTTSTISIQMSLSTLLLLLLLYLLLFHFHKTENFKKWNKYETNKTVPQIMANNLLDYEIYRIIKLSARPRHSSSLLRIYWCKYTTVKKCIIPNEWTINNS